MNHRRAAFSLSLAAAFAVACGGGAPTGPDGGSGPADLTGSWVIRDSVGLTYVASVPGTSLDGEDERSSSLVTGTATVAAVAESTYQASVTYSRTTWITLPGEAVETQTDGPIADGWWLAVDADDSLRSL